MASATGMPARLPGQNGENEPLLGQRGDVTQEPHAPIIYNLWLGTFIILHLPFNLHSTCPNVPTLETKY